MELDASDLFSLKMNDDCVGEDGIDGRHYCMSTPWVLAAGATLGSTIFSGTHGCRQ